MNPLSEMPDNIREIGLRCPIVHKLLQEYNLGFMDKEKALCEMVRLLYDSKTKMEQELMDAYKRGVYILPFPVPSP